jgi:hypothetical protein
MYRSPLNAGRGAVSADEIGAVKVTLYLEVYMNFHSYKFDVCVTVNL